MASSAGIWAGNLAPMNKVQDAEMGLVPFVIGTTTSAGTSSYSMHDGHAPFTYVVTGLLGYMRAAGGAGDTVQLTDLAGNAITEAINLAALADNAFFQAQTINDANWVIENYADDLLVVTASGAVCVVIIDCIRADGVVI